jgi:hypothetical protein
MPGSEFQWLAVVFGMLTGLGVTRLLSNIAAALRSRAVAKIDWLPMVWAASIFLSQLDYWWTLHDLKNAVQEWTYPEFLKLLIAPLLLFFAAALILPTNELKIDETHRQIFDSHGHWALLAIGGHYLVSTLESVEILHLSQLGWWTVIAGASVLLPVLAFFSSRRINGVIAVLYLALIILFIFVDIHDFD